VEASHDRPNPGRAALLGDRVPRGTTPAAAAMPRRRRGLGAPGWPSQAAGGSGGLCRTRGARGNRHPHPGPPGCLRVGDHRSGWRSAPDRGGVPGRRAGRADRPPSYRAGGTGGLRARRGHAGIDPTASAGRLPAWPAPHPAAVNGTVPRQSVARPRRRFDRGGGRLRHGEPSVPSTRSARLRAAVTTCGAPP
jgi:hypothetical protein